MNKFIYERQLNYYIVSYKNSDYAEICKNLTGSWELEYYGKDLGYTLQRYFKTLKDAKAYLNSKFDEIVNDNL